MPVSRNAPVKVVVFQWPCGTPARQRSPRGARPPQTGHLGRQPGLINEDELRWIEIELAVEPGATALQDVGAVLLQLSMPAQYSPEVPFESSPV